MKEKLTFLGIETSCDETAASIVQEKADGTGKILLLDLAEASFPWLTQAMLRIYY